MQNIGDLAGVRIDADMSLSVQTAFADSVAATIRDEVGDANVFIKDLRGGEHSGYRAVHV
ncbi:GTP pyrophosphokinase, partial [Burkholderia multivorans]